MKTSRLDYLLPNDLIATHPVEPRDSCRLLVCWRSQPGRIEHRRFRDLPEYLAPEDTLVFNTTSVLPARLRGVRTDSGGSVGGLFLAEREPGVWQVMLRSNGKLRAEQRIALFDQENSPRCTIELIERDREGWLVRVPRHGGRCSAASLYRSSQIGSRFWPGTGRGPCLVPDRLRRPSAGEIGRGSDRRAAFHRVTA